MGEYNYFFNQMNIPVVISDRLEDYQFIKTKPNFLSPRTTMHMNTNTMCWLLLGWSKRSYDYFFEQYDFETALDYSIRAATLKVNKKINHLVERELTPF